MPARDPDAPRTDDGAPTSADGALGGPGRRIACALAVLAAVVACDRTTKAVAVTFLPEGRRISLLGDGLRLERVRNAGAFLGAGSGLGPRARSAIFTWGVGTLVVAMAGVAIRRRTPPGAAAGAALVAGGGLGNLWDRLASGGTVTDFLNLGLGPVRTGIFNVADVAIVTGVLLLAFHRDRARDRPAG